jgi:hypothetical protein
MGRTNLVEVGGYGFEIGCGRENKSPELYSCPEEVGGTVYS